MHAIPRRGARAPLLLTALLVCNAPAAAGSGGAGERAVQEVLVTGWMVSGWPEEQVVTELASLGGDALPVLFGIHAGLDFGPWEGERVSFDRGPEKGAELAGRALRRMSRREVVRWLRDNVRAGAPGEARLTAAELYAALGGEEELAPCLAALGTFDEEELNEPALRRRVPACLSCFFSRVPRTALFAAKAWPTLPRHLQKVVGEALLTMEHPAALQALPALIGSGDDTRVVERMGELGQRFPWQVSRESRELVRSFLLHGDWRIRRAACVLSAQWQEVGLFEQLVALYENDPWPAVQRAAEWALHTMSGTTLQLDARGWERWLRAQEDAWKASGEELLAELASKDADVAGAALRRASKLRLYRQELAPVVAEVLFTHGGLADAVSAVLLELDSCQAVPVLVDAMESAPADRARRVAWMTLKRLTGRDLRIDDPAWSGMVAE